MNDRQHLIYWLHAVTPLHLGTGRGEGYIDLPLAREKITNFPYVPGSSVKGVFADTVGATEEVRRPSTNDDNNPAYDPVRQAAFGRAGNDASNAGALAFTDARLVCMPVQSLYGTCAWCTCPFVLKRLMRDVGAAGVPGFGAVPSPNAGAALTTSSSKLHAGGGTVFVQDLDFPATQTPMVDAWAAKLAAWVFPTDQTWQTLFTERFLIVDDDSFGFLAETGTEVQPHVRIEADFKRVATGALWYEESLPAESILVGLTWCDRVFGVPNVTRSDVLQLCQSLTGPRAVQIGGKASVGKGLTNLIFTRS